MTKIIQNRLRPSSVRLLRDIIGLSPCSCGTPEFRDTLREELTGYGWKDSEIEQAMSEVQEIADAQK